MATTNPASSPLDQATLEAFGPAQKIDPTPLDAPAPYFKVGERVFFQILNSNGHVAEKKGAVVKAAGWQADNQSYIYKLSSDETGTVWENSFPMEALETSRYGLGDVVKVKAFDTITRRTIEKIHVSDSGEFTYEIGAGFRARSKDIAGIVARRHWFPTKNRSCCEAALALDEQSK